MLTVKLEYGIGNNGTVESCATFENYEEVRKFAHDALDEILKEVSLGTVADNGLIRIWDDESDNALINDQWNCEY